MKPISHNTTPNTKRTLVDLLMLTGVWELAAAGHLTYARACKDMFSVDHSVQKTYKAENMHEPMFKMSPLYTRKKP